MYGILKTQEQFSKHVQDVRYFENAGAIFKALSGFKA